MKRVSEALAGRTGSTSRASIALVGCAAVLAACGAVEQDFGSPPTSDAPPAPASSGTASTPPAPDDGTLADWSWLNPPRGPSALRGVASSGPGDSFLAGDHGAVLHWDGAAMASLRTGTPDETLYAIWATDPRDVWIGGTRGDAPLLLRYDGSAFVEHALSETPVSIWGASPNDVWAVVARPAGATDIVHWDGAAWSAPVPLLDATSGKDLGPLALRDVYGIDASRVFAVGDGGVVLHLGRTADGRPTFVRDATTAPPFDASLHYFALWGPAEAVTGRGRLWAAFVAPDGFGLSVIDTGSSGSNPAWRVLQRGLDVYGTSAWVHKPNELSACAGDVIATLPTGPRRRGHLFSGTTSPQGIYFGALSTALLDQQPSSCGEAKYGLWALGYDPALAPEVDGTGGIWPAAAKAAYPTPPSDSAVLGLAFDGQDVLGVGTGGAFLRASPQATGSAFFQPAEPGVLDARLVSVAAVSADEAWAASSGAQSPAPLLHFRGGFWSAVPGIRGDITTVSRQGSSVWAAGYTQRTESNGMSGAAGFVVQGDGSTFQQRIVNDCDYLTSIAGVGPGEAWAVGLGAPYDWTLPSLCIVHVTPNGAVRVPTPDALTATLVGFTIPDGHEDWERSIDSAGVAAVGPNEVYIFASGGQVGFGAYAWMTKKLRVVLRWDGTSLSTVLDAPDLVFDERYGGSTPPLAARGPGDLLLGAATPLHFDGAKWTPFAGANSAPLGLVTLDAQKVLGLFGDAITTSSRGGNVRVAGGAQEPSELRVLADGRSSVIFRSPVRTSAISRADDGAVWMVGDSGATARARRAVARPTR